MDIEEYRRRGKEMVDYIADYLENIRDRRVFPNVQPGYLRLLLPEAAPLDGEDWPTIFKDIERAIMPGITHWQSPHMHAYFPALNSFPSLLGDMLADAINCLGFTWASSPACTELETIVMNWLGKMIGLPDDYLHLSKDSKGGGVIQTTASEATLVCLLAGRTQAIRRFHEKTPGFQDSEINARLVAYCSDQAHSSVEKAALIGLVRMRYIEADETLSLRGPPLKEAIEEDIKAGLIPFWVCATLGTTGACSFDNLEEVGDVCKEYQLWLHVDAAYAGSAFICPEFRGWMRGINKADSMAFNPSKWLMVHFDCTAMWVRNSSALHRTFNVEPLYLQHENSGLAIDYMHWQIPLSKKFRALKLWFVIRNYGIKGLQKHIREGVRLAQKLEALVLADHRFEIPAARHLGMVVFRIRGENELTEKLLKRLNSRGNLHCVPASLKGKYVIRFTITSAHTTNEDLLKDWNEVKYVATEILTEMNIKISERAKVSLKETRERNEAFGSSLLLANSPMSPKIVNGSFAAIVTDPDEFLAKACAGIRIANQDSPAMRRRVRGIMMSGKQFSLDSRMDLVVQGIDPSKVKNGLEEKAITEDCEDSWEACETRALAANAHDVDTASWPVSTVIMTSIEDAFVPVHERNKQKWVAPKNVDPPRSTNTNIYQSEAYDAKYTCTTIITASSQMRLKAIDKCSYSSNLSSPPYKSQSPSLESIDENRISPSFRKTAPPPMPPPTYKSAVKRQPDAPIPQPPVRNAYYNKCFDAPSAQSSPKSRRYSHGGREVKQRLPRSPFSDESENDAEVREIMRPIPKFCCRVLDEYGRRVWTSFDSSLDGDCDLDEPPVSGRKKVFASNNNLIAYENFKYCQKCGHHTPKLCD